MLGDCWSHMTTNSFFKYKLDAPAVSVFTNTKTNFSSVKHALWHTWNFFHISHHKTTHVYSCRGGQSPAQQCTLSGLACCYRHDRMPPYDIRQTTVLKLLGISMSQLAVRRVRREEESWLVQQARTHCAKLLADDTWQSVGENATVRRV